MSPLKNPKCRDCNILPFCNDGCAWLAYCRTGDAFDTYMCDVVQGKRALEIMLKLYVMDRYMEKIKKEANTYKNLREEPNSVMING